MVHMAFMVPMVQIDQMFKMVQLVQLVRMFQVVLMVSDGSYGFYGSYGSDGADRSSVLDGSIGSVGSDGVGGSVILNRYSAKTNMIYKIMGNNNEASLHPTCTIHTKLIGQIFWKPCLYNLNKHMLNIYIEKHEIIEHMFLLFIPSFN